jgi:3'(2'), 5'-bisphosphate nucleotidase
MTYQRELDAALEAARRAGAFVLKEYQQFQAIPDAPASVTTDADRQAQDIILEHLHRVFPADALCAEETTGALASVPKSGPRLWIVDPIDGTRGFARKNGEFSVMVAFVAEGRHMVGVVYEPARERLTYAAREAGCWRQDSSNQPDRCHVSDVANLTAATLTQSHSKTGGPTSHYLEVLQPARVIESYSAGIKLARVARGEADLYLNTYPKFHDWDICAGHILVDEAGGRVTGLGGQVPVYGLPGAPQSFGLLASNGKIHEAAIWALRENGLADLT